MSRRAVRPTRSAGAARHDRNRQDPMFADIDGGHCELQRRAAGMQTEADKASFGYFVPTHELSEDVAELWRERGLTAQVYYGREHEVDGEPMCLNLQQVKLARDSGLKIRRELLQEQGCQMQPLPFVPLAEPVSGRGRSSARRMDRGPSDAVSRAEKVRRDRSRLRRRELLAGRCLRARYRQVAARHCGDRQPRNSRQRQRSNGFRASTSSTSVSASRKRSHSRRSWGDCSEDTSKRNSSRPCAARRSERNSPRCPSSICIPACRQRS